ncbi:MAG: hypothetical protein M1817_003925 [Caeruleum heppii]|nr:MAG: hypothetical protein M1817_003925 [Caeruleum heppii]
MKSFLIAVLVTLCAAANAFPAGVSGRIATSFTDGQGPPFSDNSDGLLKRRQQLSESSAGISSAPAPAAPVAISAGQSSVPSGGAPAPMPSGAAASGGSNEATAGVSSGRAQATAPRLEQARVLAQLDQPACDRGPYVW